MTTDGTPTRVVPELTTDRLLLRGARRGDFEAFAADNADPVARAHLGVIEDRRTAWRLFSACMGTWVVEGSGWWMLEHRDTEAVVGMVGAFYRETLGDEVMGDLELGWVTFRTHWGRGYASEAAAAALRFGFEQLSADRAIAYIDAANVASVKVAQRIGMTHEGPVDFYGERTERYAIER